MLSRTKQNAANAEESASASEEMNPQAEHMRHYVGELVAPVGGSINDNGKAKRHLKAHGIRKAFSVDAFKFEMAERPGFEPGVELSPHTRLAGERLQPARPSLRLPINC